MRTRFELAKLRLKDWLRYSLSIRRFAGTCLLLMGRLGISSQTKLLLRTCRGLEVSGSVFWTKKVRQNFLSSGSFSDATQWQTAVAEKPAYSRLITESLALTRTIILKAPGINGEKGLLLMYFEYNLARLMLGLSKPEIEWLKSQYNILLAACWSPTDYTLLGFTVSKWDGVLFVQAANVNERSQIEQFHPEIKCVYGLACDWVNPSLYSPKPMSERTTDIVMVANWGDFKRHWEFFHALRKLPQDIKIDLIGQHQGDRTVDDIRRQQQLFGVRQDVQYYNCIDINRVSKLQENAKVSLILSRREGGCAAAVESLFAGCALGMRCDAHVGSRLHINEQTGLLLRPRYMGEDIARLLELAPTLEPRRWAIQNIGHEITRKGLNEQLKEFELKQGRPWTKDLCQVHWRPYPKFVVEAEKEMMRPAYETLASRFPKVFHHGMTDD